MDPAAQSVLETARGLSIPLESVRTFRRYYLQNHDGDFPEKELGALTQPRSPLLRVLANDAIEHIVVGSVAPEHLKIGKPYLFQLLTVPLCRLDDAELQKLSSEGQLSLSLEEMK